MQMIAIHAVRLRRWLQVASASALRGHAVAPLAQLLSIRSRLTMRRRGQAPGVLVVAQNTAMDSALRIHWTTP